ncbi:uncharacterized protein EDB93DRAFT_1132739 [Suillus bovinus]|uniref:uncharacterized protein n=1 Tax=Suillus bovinus TaxID=48563 RepID=UPI001B87D52E|nr:uncharacterized protein EDB93DRAFT_1132739 [Suillus bovinus]KAG2154518.1 hypothetical protein EDB93DRAFT_1132739 [Suillus bovinus]
MRHEFYYKFSLSMRISIEIVRLTSRRSFTMYLSILFLIYVLYVLHISRAARVIVNTDVAPGMAVPAADTQDGRLWITAILDEIIPSRVRADGRHTVDARMTPLVGALWQTGVHQEVSPSRAGNNRANEPEPTPAAVSFWKTEGIASKLSAVQHAEGPVPTHVFGLLLQTAVHERIYDS